MTKKTKPKTETETKSEAASGAGSIGATTTTTNKPLAIRPAEPSLDDIGAEFDQEDAAIEAERVAEIEAKQAAQIAAQDEEAARQNDSAEVEPEAEIETPEDLPSEEGLQREKEFEAYCAAMIGQGYADVTDLFWVPRGASETSDKVKMDFGREAMTAISSFNISSAPKWLRPWIGLSFVVAGDVQARASELRKNKKASAATSYTTKGEARDFDQ